MIRIYWEGFEIEKLEIDCLKSKGCSVKNSSILVGKISIFIYFLGERWILIVPLSNFVTLVSCVSLLWCSFGGGSLSVSIISLNSFFHEAIGYSEYFGAIFRAI